jgi:PAS domain S-box-containing protein
MSNFHLAIDLSQAYGDFFVAATKASFLTSLGIAVTPLAAVVGVLLVVRVLSRHRIEQQLLYAFFEHIPDNVYFKDRSGRFIRINRAMADYFGLAEPSDAIKKSDSDIFTSEHSQQALADDRKLFAPAKPSLGRRKRRHGRMAVRRGSLQRRCRFEISAVKSSAQWGSLTTSPIANKSNKN